MKKEVEEGDEPRAETESESEEELSCFAPTVCTHARTHTYSKSVHTSSQTTRGSSSSVACRMWCPDAQLCFLLLNAALCYVNDTASIALHSTAAAVRTLNHLFSSCLC